jgi:hypothetical protein
MTRPTSIFHSDERRITEIWLQPIFDTLEQFARYLRKQRTNAARLIEESGLQAR